MLCAQLTVCPVVWCGVGAAWLVIGAYVLVWSHLHMVLYFKMGVLIMAGFEPNRAFWWWVVVSGFGTLVITHECDTPSPKP